MPSKFSRSLMSRRYLWQAGVALFISLGTAILLTTTAFSFGASPAIIEQTVTVGDNPLPDIVVTSSKEDKLGCYQAEVLGYGQKLSGSVLVLDPEDDTSPYSGRELIQVSPSEFELAPGEPQTLKAIASIPEGATGGRYATIVVSPVEAAEAGGVAMRFRVAVAVRLIIEGGGLERTGESTDLATTQEYAQESITFLTTFRNSGNVHFSPAGVIRIKNEAGEEIGEEPIELAYVLPGYSRQLKAVWQPAELPVGDYSVESEITLEDATILKAKDAFTCIEPYQVSGAEPARPIDWTQHFTDSVRSNWAWLLAACLSIALIALWRLGKAKVSLAVAPEAIEQTVASGTNPLPDITISNSGKTTIHLQARVIGYSQNLDGSISPLEEDSSPYSGLDMVEVEPTEFDLAPGRGQRLEVMASIPQDTEGGRYALVLIRAVEEKKGKSITRFQKAVALRLTILAGTLTKTGYISEVSASQEHARKPIAFLTTFHNSGNVHFSPIGVIRIKNEAGGEIGREPIESAYVLPGYSRQLRTVWQPAELPVGDYSVESSINLEEGTTVTASSTFRVAAPYQIEGAA